MRKSWPIFTGVMVVGAVAGVAIADRSPAIESTFVIDPSSITAPTSASTTTAPPSTISVTSIAGDTTVPPHQHDRDRRRWRHRPDHVDHRGHRPPHAVAGTPDVRPRTEVRVVVANGDGRFNLAGVNGNRLEAAGYTQVDLTDAGKVPATVVYFRPGFDREAVIVAADLLVPNAIIEPLPDTPVTSNDGLGDVVVVLGPDAIR